MFKQRKVIFVFLLLALVMGSITVSAKNVTIKWWTFPIWWSGISGEETEDELAALRDAGKPDNWGDYMAQKFMKENPGVTVEYTAIPWGEEQKLDIAMATNTGPDVFYVYSALFGKYLSQEMLLPVDKYLNKTDTEDFFKEALEFSNYQGKHYLWPWIYGTEGEWVVNKSIFKESNALDLLPEGPSYKWTVEDFKKAAKKLTYTREDGTKVYGFAFSANEPIGINIWETWSFLYAFGSPLYDEVDGVTLEIKNDVQKALDLLLWLKNEKVTPPGLAGMQNEMVSDLWNRKQVAITFGGLGLINSTKRGLENGDIKPPLNPLLVLPPKQPEAKLRVSGSCEGFVINKNTSQEKMEWSMKFAQWLTAKEQEETIKIFLPSRKSAVKNIVEDDPLRKWQLNYSLPNLEPYPRSQHLNAIADVWKDVLQATLTGRYTSEHGAEVYAGKVNEILGK